ncbi:MAG TPA: hypothetical protein VFT19_07500 [Solirubrobacterales bacterium]|nr:hypothetical protein [Solirubrobacterales bacterium]
MMVDALSYAIDGEDRLIRVDKGFYRFAEQNGWHGVNDSLGRSLWDFVAGHDVKKLQKMVVRRVREGAREVELPFRCDGPEVAREMDIRIAAGRSGRVVLFSATLREEVERDEPQPLLDPDAPRGGGFLAMCAWCDRFLVSGEWIEVEEAARRLQLFRRSEMPVLDHDICPACSKQLHGAMAS